MRNKFDVLVVGGGFSGLIAACTASMNGKKTGIITKGAGSLTIGGGIVDILGYMDVNTPVKKPFESIADLNKDHPYKLVGIDTVKKSVEYFKNLTASYDFPYESDGDNNSWLPTAIGTLKPTFLRPASRDDQTLKNNGKIAVIGIKGLKDFYPELIIKGLKNISSYASKEYKVFEMANPYQEGRDITALDISRFVDREEGQRWITDELKKCYGYSTVAILPPVLGTSSNLQMFEQIRSEVGITCIEISAMPPSVTGLRLREILMKELKKHGVMVIEMAEAVEADISGKKCTSVITRSAGRDRRYFADKFIVATGGFFGGGCISTPGSAYETVFKLNVPVPEDHDKWSNADMFGNTPHLFGRFGVKVNSSLNPVDEFGEVLLENVKFVGRTLGGYDFNVEKSGNGVALATAYAAGSEL